MTRNNGFNLKEGRFKLDARQKFTQRVAKHWNTFPTGTRCLITENVQGWMGPWKTWFSGWHPCLCHGPLNWLTFKDPSNQNYSMILWLYYIHNMTFRIIFKQNCDLKYESDVWKETLVKTLQVVMREIGCLGPDPALLFPIFSLVSGESPPKMSVSHHRL